MHLIINNNNREVGGHLQAGREGHPLTGRGCGWVGEGRRWWVGVGMGVKGERGL